MEMSREQLAFRMISSLGRVDQGHMRTGMFGDEDWARINSAIAQMKTAPIYIDDSGALTPTEVRARARRLARERRTARADRHRLPAADAGGGHQGEPRDRDLRDLALAQGAREGTEGAGDRAVAAQPQRRAAHGQEAGDVGPARMRHRRHAGRAGRRASRADPRTGRARDRACWPSTSDQKIVAADVRPGLVGRRQADQATRTGERPRFCARPASIAC